MHFTCFVTPVAHHGLPHAVSRAATITDPGSFSALDRRTSASLPVQSSARLLEQDEEVVIVRALYNNDVPGERGACMA
jgi:hypothetical protein